MMPDDAIVTKIIPLRGDVIAFPGMAVESDRGV
jgi:hypothetical protein